jgi:NADPH:quinone reductase-like Zn-dependent oxidoreductase
MRKIVHHELGEPERVLPVEDSPPVPLAPDEVRVRVSYAPIHPGDLLGIAGSSAFGTPPTIASGGRTPGFEGAGVVSGIGSKVDPALGLREGLRVVDGARLRRHLPFPFRYPVAHEDAPITPLGSPAGGGVKRWCRQSLACAG